MTPLPQGTAAPWFERRAGWAVIGGVLFSTFLTLFVSPLVFGVLEKLTPRRFRIKKDVEVDAVPVTAPLDAKETVAGIAPRPV